MENQEFILKILEKLDSIEKGQNEMRHEVKTLGQKMDGLEKRMDGLEKRMDGLEKRMDGLEKRMDGLEKRMDGFEQRMNGFEQNIKTMQDSIDRNFNETIETVSEMVTIIGTKIEETEQRLLARISDSNFILDSRITEVENTVSDLALVTERNCYRIEVLDKLRRIAS